MKKINISINFTRIPIVSSVSLRNSIVKREISYTFLQSDIPLDFDPKRNRVKSFKARKIIEKNILQSCDVKKYINSIPPGGGEEITKL